MKMICGGVNVGEQGQAAEAERQNRSALQAQLQDKLKEVSAEVKTKNKTIKELEKEVK
jgi:hypothetical protein